MWLKLCLCSKTKVNTIDTVTSSTPIPCAMKTESYGRLSTNATLPGQIGSVESLDDYSTEENVNNERKVQAGSPLGDHHHQGDVTMTISTHPKQFWKMPWVPPSLQVGEATTPQPQKILAPVLTKPILPPPDTNLLPVVGKTLPPVDKEFLRKLEKENLVNYNSKPSKPINKPEYVKPDAYVKANSKDDIKEMNQLLQDSNLIIDTTTNYLTTSTIEKHFVAKECLIESSNASIVELISNDSRLSGYSLGELYDSEELAIIQDIENENF